MVFLGVVLVCNLMVVPHVDKRDYAAGWTVMTVFGDFHGGDLVLPNVKVDNKILRFKYQPGDVIFFKGALMEHYVMGFEGSKFFLFSFFCFRHTFVYARI